MGPVDCFEHGRMLKTPNTFGQYTKTKDMNTTTKLIFTLTAVASFYVVPICHAQESWHAIAIPELTGVYSNIGDLRAADFDFNSSFATISDVLLAVEFTDFTETVCTGSNCSSGTFFDVAIREPGIVTVADPDFGPAYSFSGHAPVVETRAHFFFATDFVQSQSISLEADTLPLDVLDDGSGSIAFRLSGGPATISNVQLLVQGTSVPEPSSIVLGSMLIALGVFHRTPKVLV